KTIDISLNGTVLKIITLDNNISSAAELKEFTIPGVGTGVDTIRFSAPKATSNRFFIDDVKICKLEAIEGSPFSVAPGETCYKVSIPTSGVYSYTIQATNNIYTSEESNEVTVAVNSTSEATAAKVRQTTFILSKGAVTIFNPTQYEKITIYNTNGTIVAQFAPTKTIRIPLPAGIYLIRSLNNSQKVVIN
ncbi:MAG: T9SS type A sorting domain-containing protein, partial [Bacteroidota bacterium]|nr:T9SS type A sorting domain-containing protein [Bacteroidota bacterium]